MSVSLRCLGSSGQDRDTANSFYLFGRLCDEIAYGAVEGKKLGVIELRDIDPEPLVEGCYKVEEVDGVDIKRLS